MLILPSPTVKKWLRSSLKLLNLSIGVGCIALIIFGLLMIRVWQSHLEDDSSSDHLNFPWFFHAFLGLGIAFCAVTVLGHIAAYTANFRCFTPIVITGQVFFDPNLKKELPEELSERFDDDFKDLVDSWRWFGKSIFVIQGVCFNLTAVLWTYYQIESITNVIEQVNEQTRRPLMSPLAHRPLNEPYNIPV